MLDKQRYLKGFTQPDEKILFAKVLDQADFSLEKFCPVFTRFLDPLRVMDYQRRLGHIYGLQMFSYGGTADCERRMLGFCPEELPFSENDFPIATLKITWDTRFFEAKTHRDYLGAILGLGIDRSKVGDIFIGEDAAWCFLQEELAAFVCENLKSVGRMRVKATVAVGETVFVGKEMTESTLTVPSCRLDAVLAALFHLSRSEAKNLIEGEKATCNWKVAINPSAEIKEGDLLSVRGKGRGKVIEIKGTTKKDRILLLVGRYQ